MDQDRILIGMKVKIIGIENTHERHNSCSGMEYMIGHTYNVELIREANQFSTARYGTLERGTKAITVNDDNKGYVWAPEDLEYAGPEIKLPKKETFNPDNIVRM